MKYSDKDAYFHENCLRYGSISVNMTHSVGNFLEQIKEVLYSATQEIYTSVD
jgi:hypothetical protein